MVDHLRHRTHHHHQEHSSRPAAGPHGHSAAQHHNNPHHQPQLPTLPQQESAPHQLLVFAAPVAADTRQAGSTGRLPLPSSLRWLQVRVRGGCCLALHMTCCLQRTADSNNTCSSTLCILMSQWHAWTAKQSTHDIAAITCLYSQQRSSASIQTQPQITVTKCCMSLSTAACCVAALPAAAVCAG